MDLYEQTLESIRNNDIQFITELFQCGIDINSLGHSFDLPLLMGACESGRVEIVKLMIDNNINLNVQHLKKDSLYVAIDHNHIEICDILIKAGHNITAKHFGLALSKNVGMVSLLIDSGYQPTNLSYLMLIQDDEILLYLHNKFGLTNLDRRGIDLNKEVWLLGNRIEVIKTLLLDHPPKMESIQKYNLSQHNINNFCISPEMKALLMEAGLIHHDSSYNSFRLLCANDHLDKVKSMVRRKYRKH